MKMHLLLIIFIAIMPYAYSEDEVIKIVSDEWCPYTCNDQNSNKGILIDIVQEIFAQHNIKVEYYNNIWSLALEDIRGGYADAIAGVSKYDTRDLVFPDIQQANAVAYFYTMPNTSWKYRGESSLRKITLGSVDGYTYGDKIDKYISNNIDDVNKIVLVRNSFNSIDTLYNNVVRNNIDTFIEDPMVLEYYLVHNGKEIRLQISGLADSGTQENGKIYVAFSPKNDSSERYAKILSEGVIKMKRNNSVHDIIEKYGLTYWNW